MDTKYTEYQNQSHLAYLGYQQETIESPSLSFPINVYPKTSKNSQGGFCWDISLLVPATAIPQRAATPKIIPP